MNWKLAALLAGYTGQLLLKVNEGAIHADNKSIRKVK